MTEYKCWRVFVLTSIGLFFTTLCILDACIRNYWIRKQRRAEIITSQYRIQQLPRYRTEEILKVRNLLRKPTINEFKAEIEREDPRPYYRPRPFDWS